MNSVEAPDTSPENLIREVGQSILAVAEDLRARAWEGRSSDEPFQPTIPDAIVPLPFEDALAQFDRSCHSARYKMDEVIDDLRRIVNHSLTLQLAASMASSPWDEMQVAGQQLDGL